MTDKTTHDPSTGQRTTSYQSGATGSTGGSSSSSAGSYGSTTGSQTSSQYSSQDAAERERARRAAEDLKHAAKDVAASTAGAVKSRVAGELDYRKYKGRQRLSRVATALRETGASLDGDDDMVARYADRAAERIDRFAEYLDRKDVNQIMADARRVARQRPEIFVGGLFVAGLMLGRFLRSAKPAHDEYSGAYGGDQWSRGDEWSRGGQWRGDEWSSSATRPSTTTGSSIPSTPTGGVIP